MRAGQMRGLQANLMSFYKTTVQIARQFKSFHVGHLLLRRNADADAIAVSATSLTLLPGISKKIWVFTKDLYCHDPLPEDVSLLSTVKLRNHRQPRHLED